MKTEQELTDRLDLMVDEFQRIKVLAQDTEIKGICDRAVKEIKQHVPVIVQRDNAEHTKQDFARLLSNIHTLVAPDRHHHTLAKDEADCIMAAVEKLFKDFVRLDHLEKLILNCPHAEFDFNDDPDIEDAYGKKPLGFRIRVEGCETVDVHATSFRECVDNLIIAGMEGMHP